MIRKTVRMLAVASLIALCVGVFAFQAEAVSIDFNDGTNNDAVGNFYAGLGVIFANTQWSNVIPQRGDPPGVSGLKIISISNGYAPPPSSPLVATFSSGVSAISIMVLDVGVAGVLINAFDAAVGGNLVAFDEEFGPIVGIGNHVLLSLSGSGIYRLEMYQPLANNIDGILFDNLSFTAAAPIPGALLLVSSGLMIIGFRKRFGR